MGDRKFSSCGMYAFNHRLRQAWQALFDEFHARLGSRLNISRALSFGSDDGLLRDPRLLLGHTCGYPLAARLRDELTPLCVPVFDVPGMTDRHYTSHIIVPAVSTIRSLADCRDRVATINALDSNSGMNLLRYELARLGAMPGYFARVDISGSHYDSLSAVAANRAQLAAIDCVSFQLIADQNPTLAAAVRCVGYCQSTCGLPFVMRRSEFCADHAEACLRALHQALENLPVKLQKSLRLDRFEAVAIDDYASIIELEAFAIKAGYPAIS